MMLSVQVCRIPGLRLAALIVLAILMTRGEAGAQIQAQEPRIGPFAIDVRGVLAAYGPTEEQAAAAGTTRFVAGVGLSFG